MKQNVFRSRRNKSVDRCSFSSVGSLFHARGAATEKALSASPIRRRVRGTTRLPHDEARSVDRPGILATNVRRSEIYSSVCSRSDLWTSKHSLYWILSATGNHCQQCNSRRAGVTRSHGLRSRTVHAAACRTRWNGASVEAGRPASTALQYSRRDRTSAVTSLAVTWRSWKVDVGVFITGRRTRPPRFLYWGRKCKCSPSFC